MVAGDPAYRYAKPVLHETAVYNVIKPLRVIKVKPNKNLYINMIGRGCSLLLSVIVVIISYFLIIITNGEEVKEVITRDGRVRGRLADDGDYMAFLGIPYAAPPIGNLRYKKPQRLAKPWSGVLPERTAACVQEGGGQEDCLLLHVFTPKASSTELLPVFVFIHGGGFVMSRPNTIGYGPLVNEGLIVVSMNYRLGALGWLCLGTEESPGNAGLWDQVAALQWVQDNIGAFDGDPTRVTLGGMSAGSISAHILTLTKAQYLFQQVICLEGTAIAQFSAMTTPLAYAKYYATLLGYETDSVTDLQQFYMQVSAEAIGNKSKEFFMLDNGETGFGPCIEREIDGVESILTKPPASLLARFNKPAIFSFSDNEGSLYGLNFNADIDRYNDYFETFVPSNLDFPPDIKDKKNNEIKEFYFGTGNITQNDTEPYSKYWADSLFLYPAVASALAAKQTPAYLLEFGYVGGLSVVTGLPGVSGAGHGDMIHYLFPSENATNEDDKRVVQEVAKMVANFVRSGNPSLSNWLPITAEALSYLHLGNQTETRFNPYPERMSFWRQLYDKYRKTNYTWDRGTTV